MQPVLSYIDEHYNEKITLEQMSELVNFDKSHFCRVFKRCVNASLVDYINYIRISKAEKLLLSTNKSISEIAEEISKTGITQLFKLFFLSFSIYLLSNYHTHITCTIEHPKF